MRVAQPGQPAPGGPAEAAAYIAARPRYHRGAAEPPFSLWHGSYAGFAAAAHAHEHVQVILPIAGRMRLSAAGAEHVLGPEAAAIVPGGVDHAFTYLDAELEFLAVDAPTGWPQPLTAPAVAHAPGAWLMARALAAEVDRGAEADPALLALGREALGRYLQRALRQAPRASRDDDVQARRVMRAVDRILRDYAQPLKVEALAEEQAMSARHFERCFKAAVGQPPRRFLIEVRLRAARELLATTVLPVAAVGEAVGFPNPAHFADTFARRVGVSPGAWRTGRRPDA